MLQCLFLVDKRAHGLDWLKSNLSQRVFIHFTLWIGVHSVVFQMHPTMSLGTLSILAPLYLVVLQIALAVLWLKRINHIITLQLGLFLLLLHTCH
jgi:hypothetical protein